MVFFKKILFSSSFFEEFEGALLMTKKKRKKRVLRNLRLSPRVGRGGKETKENLKKKNRRREFLSFFSAAWELEGFGFS